MKNRKRVNQILTRNIIISSVIWASVILACTLNPVNSNKEILYILISGFFVEFLRMTSSNKLLKKYNQKENDKVS